MTKNETICLSQLMILTLHIWAKNHANLVFAIIYSREFGLKRCRLREAGLFEKPANYDKKKCQTTQNEEYEFNLMINKECLTRWLSTIISSFE